MTSVVLYLRVSTEEQVSNLSLATQEAECRALCERRGWKIVEVYLEEGASAKTLDRPQMRRMLADLGRRSSRVEALVFLRIDRISREIEDYYVLRHALRKLGVRLVSVREEIDPNSIEGVILESVTAMQAKIDNLLRAARAKTGMQEAIRRGRWVWCAPVGYRHAEHRDGRPVGLELDPEAAPLVRRAFEQVAAGASVDAAYRDAIAAGLRGARGGKIGRQTFHAMLARPIYCGRLDCAAWGLSTASAAPPIVTEETWSRARQALAGRARPHVATTSLADFPLRGVARCTCGRKLSAFHARGKSGRRWPYYRCQRCRINVPARELERAFSTLLDRSALPEAAIAYVDAQISEALQRDAERAKQRIEFGQRRLKAADQRLERLLQMRLDGELPADEYGQARAKILAERDAARVDLADLSTPAADPGPMSAWSRQLLTRPAETWQTLAGLSRAMFAAGAFPGGIEYQDGEFSNPARSLLQLPPDPVDTPANSVVRPTGTASNPIDNLLTWRKALVDLEAAVLHRAA